MTFEFVKKLTCYDSTYVTAQLRDFFSTKMQNNNNNKKLWIASNICSNRTITILWALYFEHKDIIHFYSLVQQQASFQCDRHKMTLYIQNNPLNITTFQSTAIHHCKLLDRLIGLMMKNMEYHSNKLYFILKI